MFALIFYFHSMSQKLIGEEESKLKTFIRKKGIYVAMAATVVGLFIGIPLIFWLYSKMIISVGFILLLLFICGALGLIQWEYVRSLLDMEYHQFAMYAFSGFGICLMNVLLLLNLITSIDTYSKTYKVDDIKVYDETFRFTLAGDDVDFALEFVLNEYITSHYDELPDVRSVNIHFETGALGIDKIVGCDLILPEDL